MAKYLRLDRSAVACLDNNVDWQISHRIQIGRLEIVKKEKVAVRLEDSPTFLFNP